MDIIDDAPERFEKARQWILKGLNAPTDFPPQLEIISDLIEQGETKFKTLNEFISAPINHDGIGIKDKAALELMLWYNPDYDHVSKRLSVKLGLAEQAKHIEPFSERGKHKQENRGKKSVVDNPENINYTSEHQGGTSTAYRLAKIARDYPELSDRIKAGEFAKAIDAERALGLKPPLRESKRLTMFKDDPKAAIKALSEYYGIEVNYEG